MQRQDFMRAKNALTKKIVGKQKQQGQDCPNPPAKQQDGGTAPVAQLG